MIKNSNGITLVSLIITIAVMMIIASITVSTSMDRFEINNLNKMINDIEFLKEKVSNYYLKYNELPVVKDADNKSIEYTNINFSVDTNDNEKYYIIDLESMGDIALNYGKEGFENANSSDDVYIINEKTHNIYYVKGIEWNEEYHHFISDSNGANDEEDTIPPSTPQIKVISGTKNEEGIYTSDVEIEITPGKDKWSGVAKTTYLINNETEIEITLEDNVLSLAEDGEYNIIVKTYDKYGNYSENNIEIEISLPIQEDELNTNEM